MMKQKWYSNIGAEKIEVIECLDSGSQRVWIKFEPINKSKPMEVCNILVQPNKVSWRYKNSHFETIDNNSKSNYYKASSAGSLYLKSGSTVISKDSGSKVLVFSLTSGSGISVNGNAIKGSQFTIDIPKPTWVGYVISGSGTINPI